MKLPKQIYYWAYKAGLRNFKHQLRGYKYYWKGHGRNFRVNMHGELQISEPYAEFDRWANSTAYTFPMPTTEKQFKDIINEYCRKS